MPTILLAGLNVTPSCSSRCRQRRSSLGKPATFGCSVRNRTTSNAEGRGTGTGTNEETADCVIWGRGVGTGILSAPEAVPGIAPSNRSKTRYGAPHRIPSDSTVSDQLGDRCERTNRRRVKSNPRATPKCTSENGSVMSVLPCGRARRWRESCKRRFAYASRLPSPDPR